MLRVLEDLRHRITERRFLIIALPTPFPPFNSADARMERIIKRALSGCLPVSRQHFINVGADAYCALCLSDVCHVASWAVCGAPSRQVRRDGFARCRRRFDNTMRMVLRRSLSLVWRRLCSVARHVRRWRMAAAGLVMRCARRAGGCCALPSWRLQRPSSRECRWPGGFSLFWVRLFSL